MSRRDVGDGAGVSGDTESGSIKWALKLRIVEHANGNGIVIPFFIEISLQSPIETSHCEFPLSLII